MEKILKKSYKILFLSFVILILALVFFLWRGRELYQAIKPSSQFRLTPLSPGFTIESGSGSPQFDFDISKLPSPNKFSSFSYNPSDPNRKKTLELKIECHDAYYTILIFNIKDDYRQNPGAARFNQAAPCPPRLARESGEAGQIGEKIKRSIDLEKLNLSTGKYYYIIADQGSTGSWYNPR